MEDDLNFFPKYEAVILYKSDLEDNKLKSIGDLESKIDESLMMNLNLIAETDKSIINASREFFLRVYPNDKREIKEDTIVDIVIDRGREHLFLVFYSMIFAIVIGVFLGFFANKYTFLANPILASTAILQTIPSLALLAFLIPLTGISQSTAVIALLLYSLLPIVSNTYQGFNQIDKEYIDTASALGLSDRQTSLYVKAPMAMPFILTGIKTSLVINVGTATLAALIGAGGFGAPILSGIALNDQKIILVGAIPAAILAVLCQLVMTFLERFLIPKGIRIEKGL